MFSRIKRQAPSPEIERLADEVASLRADIKSLLQVSSIAAAPRPQISKEITVQETETKKKKKGDMINPDDCDVMISLNCRTMLPTAQRIRTFLEENGVKVWLCVNMAAGADFRDEIISAVDSCEVFLPLINEAWCESKECKYEFNYCFRKNLTSDSQIPAIIPMCMPDLRWNAHAHVRALLANTNALVFNDDKESEVLQRLKDALQLNGLNLKNTKPSTWSAEDLKEYLQRMLLNPFEGEENNGMNFLEMDSAAFEEKVLRAAKEAKEKAIDLQRKALAEEESIAMTDSMESDASTLSSLGAMVAPGVAPHPPANAPNHTFEGMYKVIAKTTNYYDQNVTKSNVFLVTLSKNGIGSTGCCWTAGSIHSNYDGVTSVWQGDYRESDGIFFFASMYSNETEEEYQGKFERCDGGDRYLFSRGMSSKYAWFGYGRESYGMVDMFMCKLTKEEETAVKVAMQSIALGDSNAVSMEALMQKIGPEMSWDEFHESADYHPVEVITQGLCSTPLYNAALCLYAPIAVQLKLPPGLSSADNCIVSIISEGETEPDNEYFFYANEYVVARGYVFPRCKVPQNIGNYEIALFHQGEKVLSTPITICTETSWKKR